ncbi:MAG: hypothetical protein CVU62_13865 [Deltaproteobacteria bacterium HGW-Deltaproteobacteria-2]|jgi:hypothetical protein|nr:MAG: hypothetical protein CVU62_13865 [Deltaproteobacteria bacterium HGW-Deltaproteobacteria-2]
MAILWFGGEDIDFPTFTGCFVNTTAGTFDASYARAGISIGDGGAATSTQFPSGAVTSCWLRYYQGNQGFNNNKFLGLGSFGTAYKGLWVGSGTSDSKFAIWKYVTSWTKLAEESGNHFVSGIFIDLQLIDYGATGTINVYANGVLVVTYTGNLSVTGVSGFDCIMLGAYGTTNMNPVISEIIVADEDTRTMRLAKLVPTSDGTTTDMVGDYSAVDETTINDADGNYTDTAGKDQQFNVSDLPAGTFAIKAVKIACRACKTVDASIGKLALGYNSGGTVAVGADQTLTTAWATYESLNNTNPVTGNAWLQSEMNALQLNVRSAT